MADQIEACTACTAAASEIAQLNEKLDGRARDISALEDALTEARSVGLGNPRVAAWRAIISAAAPDVLALLGAVILSFGAGMVYRPAALIVFGALLLWSGLAAARAD
jgi:hypothetical protein